jgi:signal transduction histidine kinase/DNA-binding response OmpR family regulator
LALDDNGTLYIGGVNEIGFMEPDAKGDLQYSSLTKHLSGKHKNFDYVWATYAINDGVYFQTSHYLFYWQAGKLRISECGGRDRPFHTSFYCGEKLFVRQHKVGLLQAVKGSLSLIPGGEKFASLIIYLLVLYEDQKMIIGTRNKGFFLFDGTNLEPFLTAADKYIKKKQLYQGIRLKSSPGQFSLATRQGGLIIIDSMGKLKATFDTTTILPDRGVNHVFEDFQGNLWLSLNRGISKIEHNSPLSFFNEKSGLPGIVLSMIKHNGTLFVGTYNGLYRLSPDGIFYNVSGIVSPCWSLLSTEKSLLVAATHGLLWVEEGKQEKIIENASYVLQQSQKEPRRVWVGTRNGLVSIYLKNRRWRKERRFPGIEREIRTTIEDEDGSLWLGCRPSGVIRVDFPAPGTVSNPVINRYDKEHGLPDQEIRVFRAAGHVMFAAEDGLFRFGERKNRFIPDHTFGDEYCDGSNNVFCLAEDSDGDIYFHSMLRNIRAVRKPDGTFDLKKKPFLSLSKVQTNAIYSDPDGTCVWFASNYGLIRYDKNIEKDYDLDFSTVIRRVWINDNMVFGGHKSKVNSDFGAGLSLPIIDYKDRNLRFEFAAPFFEGEEETHYSCLLEGYDTGWTGWAKDNKANYTNLDGGMYTFRVRAKNVYGNISREDSYRFRVLPPWYQTWWAYLLYGLAVLFFVYLLVRWRSGKLAREKKRLERVVKERTKEIEARTKEIDEKNIRLEEQTGKLQEQSEKLKEMAQVKSRFFANISHEFRTPLTLIMGPLEQMIAKCPEDEDEKKRKYTMMLRNAQRLLRLINQLLELSKLDSGKMKLQAVKTGILTFVKGIVDSFRVLTQQKEIELVYRSVQDEQETETGEISLYIDTRKMEVVLANLLMNAVKFTPPGGEVRVVVKENPGDGKFPSGYVEIIVSNTGPGIPEEQLENVFDRFYQADTTYEYHHKGSGIGLALSKELVVLHHGTIAAVNREDGGIDFMVKLPLGDAHLTADEVVVSDTEAPLTSVSPGVLLENRHLESCNTFDNFNGKEKNIILIVEDSADMRGYIRDALEPDYIVEEAGDGREGMEKARQIIPDLIISDIMMPEADGDELCRTLKNEKNTCHVPIVLLTAKASEENVVAGLETGADDYITKPFSTKILLARIKNLIDIRSQLQLNINRELLLQPVKTEVSHIDREFLQEVHEIIDTNISDEGFNVEQLGKKLYMGRTTLYRKILALSGLRPTEFIRSYRLKRGAELLKQNYGSVLEVSLEVGFANSSYFAKCFKEKFHRLPSEYQAANKE